MPQKTQRNLPLSAVTVDDAFWSPVQSLVKDVVIPYQADIFHDRVPGAEKSHAIENFRIAAGEAEGEYYGMVFQDSDLAKWLEAASYALAHHESDELRAAVDEVVDLVARAQQPDGYLNTYFTIKEPQYRWANLLEWHELYCAGHMIEAAVAHNEATREDTLLATACRLADHICDRFGPDGVFGVPGHQEIELALLRLSRLTGNMRYREMAELFLKRRGEAAAHYEEEAKHLPPREEGLGPRPIYQQFHLPVTEQKEAVGHSVRALYMYTAMADLAAETGDEALYSACQTLWQDVTEKKMYVTGAVGSTVEGESFTIAHDLPNDTIYGETCAAIALVFFARRMLEAKSSGAVADVLERALYNGVLGGMQLDGKRFFYVNPLEVVPGVTGELYGHRHVLPQRPGWYRCACCPPNVARLTMSLGRYAWGEGENTLYAHLFLGGNAQFTVAGGGSVSCATAYPWQGGATYTVTPNTPGAAFVLAVHLPAWCQNPSFTINGQAAAPRMQDGYACIERAWQPGDKVQIDFTLAPQRVYANPAVRADAGLVAIQRGPVVYCAEQADNGSALCALRLPDDAAFEEATEPDGKLKGFVTLTANGQREAQQAELYATTPPRQSPATLKLVPYFAWGNRQPGEMRVWLRR